MPTSASFSEPEPEHADALVQALGCPVRFAQPENLLNYPAAWLSREPRLANPLAAAQVSAQCATLLAAHARLKPMTRRVQQQLCRNHGPFPSVEAVAEALFMTSRTLRRRLEAESTSYSELLTDMRKARAIDWLRGTAMNTDDIASNLGFSDPVAFRHAFKRWTGQSPSEYRRSAMRAAA